MHSPASLLLGCHWQEGKWARKEKKNRPPGAFRGRIRPPRLQLSIPHKAPTHATLFPVPSRCSRDSGVWLADPARSAPRWNWLDAQGAARAQHPASTRGSAPLCPAGLRPPPSSLPGAPAASDWGRPQNTARGQSSAYRRPAVGILRLQASPNSKEGNFRLKCHRMFAGIGSSFFSCLGIHALPGVLLYVCDGIVNWKEHIRIDVLSFTGACSLLPSPSLAESLAGTMDNQRMFQTFSLTFLDLIHSKIGAVDRSKSTAFEDNYYMRCR